MINPNKVLSQANQTNSQFKVAGGATLVYLGQGDCGCQKYRAAIGKKCKGQYTWQIQRKVGFLNWVDVGPQVTTPGGSSADWEFELCPETHVVGWYRVKIKCTKGWLFAKKTNKLKFTPAPYNILLETLLNGSKNYKQDFCCGEHLLLSTKDQACVLRWRVYVSKWSNISNSGYGPSYFGPWNNGAAPANFDVNAFFESQNLDMVPGQCYKIDLEVQGLVNNTQWPSVGKIFCISCKCEGG